MRVVVGLVALLGAASCQESALDLSSTTQDLVKAPASSDLGSVQIGQTSAPVTLTISPASVSAPSSDTVAAITESCPDFAIDAPGLPAAVYRTCGTACPAGQLTCQQPLICAPGGDYQDYSFTATFSPIVAGMVSCVVTVALDGGSTTKSITLTGVGTAPPVQLDVQPPSLAFGDVRTGADSSSATLTVRDAGGLDLGVTGITVPAGFALAGPTSFTLAPGATQPLGITCHPTATGPLGGTIQIASNDPQSPRGVPVSCNGVTSNLEITPSPATIPPTLVGAPVVQHISLANAGTAATTVTDIALDGAGLALVTSVPGSTVLAPTGSLGLDVRFDAVAHGAASGTLTVTTTDGVRTAQISASALLASLSLSPDGNVDLGPVCAGASTTQLFTVVGNGDGSFAVTALSAPDAPFTLAAPALPATVAASGGNQVTFDLTAAPTAAGPLTTTVMIETDIPADAPHPITVSATGLAAGTTATPSALDLGRSPLDTTTIGQPILVTNCSANALAFTAAHIDGSDAGEFAIVAEPPGGMIAADASAQWLVVLSAHSAGVKTAMFSVETADGTSSTVALAGEGLAEGSGAGSDAASGERNYYSCSVGDEASGLAPLVIALALRVRRRRRPG